jgi:hypothetical protein
MARSRRPTAAAARARRATWFLTRNRRRRSRYRLQHKAQVQHATRLTRHWQELHELERGRCVTTRGYETRGVLPPYLGSEISSLKVCNDPLRFDLCSGGDLVSYGMLVKCWAGASHIFKLCRYPLRFEKERGTSTWTANAAGHISISMP